MKWDQEVDVVCIGSGAAGLTAAAAAANAGATVLLVEKDSKLGGVTARSGGQLWFGANELEAELGIADTLEETYAYLEELSQGLADPALRQAFVLNGQVTLHYLRETLGIPLAVIQGIPDYYHPVYPGSKPEGRYLEVDPFEGKQLGEWADRCVISPFDTIYSYLTFRDLLAARNEGAPINNVDRNASQDSKDSLADLLKRRMANDERCMGAGLIGWLLKAALDRGVTPLLSTRAVRLIAGGGGVEGIVLVRDGQEQSVRARSGVVLATGGYDWNSEYMQSFENLSDAGSMAPTTIEGDHLTMASDVGAMPVTARSPWQTPIFVGYEVPGHEVDGHPLHRCWDPGNPHSIVVNAAGHRFVDDSFYPHVLERVTGSEDGEPPEWPAWLVFDQTFLDNYGLPPFAPGQGLPEGLGNASRDLLTLAHTAGIDSVGLESTVGRFNSFCLKGEDPDFGRGTWSWSQTMVGDVNVHPNPNLGPIDNAPYYALKLERVAMGVPSAGLRIDANAQVINEDGLPVAGLYAAGNAAAWLEIGGGYNSGMPNARGLIFGYLAGVTMTS